MRQRELEMRLERVPATPRPRAELEQYRTPAPVAADLLYRALGAGDVADRSLADLGCGTGIFLAGAGLLGAARLTGIDIDPQNIDVARQTMDQFGVEAELHTGPVESLEGPFDTVVMNPPFGAQLAQRHADALFLQHALLLAPTVYSLHLEPTYPHLRRLASRLDADARVLTRYDFPIPHSFRFHTKERVLVPVVLLRSTRRGP